MKLPDLCRPATEIPTNSLIKRIDKEMAVILNIETSTTVCSVAVTFDGMVLSHREYYEGRNHASLLSGFIKD